MCIPETLHSEPKPTDGPRVWERGFVEPVDDAQDRVERERREVTAEIEALREFIDRVRSFSVTESTPVDHPGMQTLTTRSGSTHLSELCDAYRETVMATAHYEREYDESLATNLAAELGPDVASALCDGGEAPVAPQIQQAVIVAAGEACQDREVFLDQLDSERESLAQARRRLAEVARAIDTKSEGGPISGRPSGLATRYHAIERVESVLCTRQDVLHTRSGANRTNGHSLCAYLYGENGTYPVLRSAAMLLEALDGEQK